MKIDGNFSVNNKNHLEISGCDCVELAKEFKTPLYVMDVKKIKSVANAYKQALSEYYDNNGKILFASKAFSTKAIYALMDQLNMGIDTVSLGEMYTAKSAGFDLKNAYFHGNNKTIEEIEYAISNNIGKIIIDSFDDIAIINDIAKKKDIVQNVLIRINPGVVAHTHSFIQTSKIDSKFGFGIEQPDFINILLSCKTASNIKLDGLHIHIGSQIFDIEGYKVAIDKITTFIKKIATEFNIICDELNLGGGFGITYSEDDKFMDEEIYKDYIKQMVDFLKNQVIEKDIKMPYIVFEPGRSLVGAAGITLYEIGTIKDIPNVIKYVNIDGGMGDNIRPALYGAKYEAVIANRVLDEKVDEVSIAGKYCESADILIFNLNIAKAQRGDILCVFSTGAYNYSMASNYNRNLIPAVVFVEDGKAEIAVERQSYQQLVQNDVIPSFIAKGEKNDN